MDLKAALRPLFYRRQFNQRFGPAWSKFLVQNKAWLATLARPSPDGVQLYENGPILKERNTGALIAIGGIEAIQALAKRYPIHLQIKPETVEIDLGEVHFQAESPADLLAIGEVFADQIYALQVQGPLVVLDLGANIGAASLYFALRPDTTVEAYELLPSTAKLAQKNIDLNPNLAPKITLHPFGVGPKEETLQVTADPKLRSSVSIQLPIETNTSHKETAQVKSIQKVFQALPKPPNTKLLVKMDIEGAEYDLLPNMADQLREVDYLILEYHQLPNQSPESLIEILKAQNFQTTQTPHPTHPVGLITAKKS